MSPYSRRLELSNSERALSALVSQNTDVEEKNGTDSPSKVAGDAGETKDTQKVKLNDGGVVTAPESGPQTDGDKKKKDRSIKSEYYELPAKHEDVWLSIKEMYGLDEVWLS